jgi:hypothetical protein
LDSNDTVVNLALHPAGYEPIPTFPPVSDLTFDLTQALIPLNSAVFEPRSILEPSARSPTVNRLRYNPITVASRAHSSTADSSVGPGSIVGSSILETSYIGSSATPARGGNNNAKVSETTNKRTLKSIMTRYPNWGKALSNLRCMVRVAVCRGDYSSLFSLVMADYVAERTMVIRSIWPETLIRCNLQQKDLERGE